MMLKLSLKLAVFSKTELCTSSSPSTQKTPHKVLCGVFLLVKVKVSPVALCAIICVFLPKQYKSKIPNSEKVKMEKIPEQSLYCSCKGAGKFTDNSS